MVDTSAPVPVVEVERLGPVSRIWMNRPGVRNAQNVPMLEAITAAFDEASADDDVRVIVLAGRGAHFCSGHDLRELGPDYMCLSVERRYELEMRRYYDHSLRIWDNPKPTIAQVQGACIAGGFMTAAMCDLIVASDDAYFSDPVVALGSSAVELLFHPWALGSRLAKDLLFTGRRLDAHDAAACGLVSRVVPQQDLDDKTIELALKIAEAPAFSVQLTKRSVNRTLEIQGFRSALQAHFDTHQLVHAAQGVSMMLRAKADGAAARP